MEQYEVQIKTTDAFQVLIKNLQRILNIRFFQPPDEPQTAKFFINPITIIVTTEPSGNSSGGTEQTYVLSFEILSRYEDYVVRTVSLAVNQVFEKLQESDLYHVAMMVDKDTIIKEYSPEIRR